MEAVAEPKTLQEAIVYFADQDNCLKYLAAKRWPSGKVICPTCGGDSVIFLAKQKRWKCRVKHTQQQFSVKVGTVMEDSPIGLDKWLMAMWQIVNSKNGISSYEVHRAIGVTQKTAWFLDHRIRFALGMEPSPEQLSGEVEVDETFIGGKARNMHAKRRRQVITGTGPKDKVAVMGLLERGGKVRAMVVPSRKKKVLQAEVKKHVEAGSAIFSDALLSYEGLDKDFAHGVVDHAVAYVDGKIHTNGRENFWSLLKRGLHGTYVSVEPFHLFRYLDEKCFKFNNRKMTDSDRFRIAVDGIVGKRLTYATLTGKIEEAVQS